MPRLLRADTHRARQLRRKSTPAESALWQLLRGRAVGGAKFRRQQPLGPYIVEFCCFEARLVIEADGAVHYPRPQGDRQRDALLRAAGMRVLRLPNREILTQPERVLERIRRALARDPAPPSPANRERGAGGGEGDSFHHGLHGPEPAGRIDGGSRKTPVS